MKSGIYKITCISTSKFYIGSSEDVLRRKDRHYSDLKRGCHINSYLQRSFDKYGRDQIRFEIIEFCKDIISREQYYIDTLKPHFNARKVASSNPGLGKPILQIDF